MGDNLLDERPDNEADEPVELLDEIVRIDHFYHTPRGAMMAHFLRAQIRPLIKLGAGLEQIGFGYPFMCGPVGGKPFGGPVLIPGEMGALCHGWQANETHLDKRQGDTVMTATISSGAWPVQSEYANQIVMCHGLEYCYDRQACLAEANRVLVSAGELLLMVPHRRSLWVHDDGSPLGSGQPFSKRQITRLLRNAGFEIISVARALYLPPAGLGLGLRLGLGMAKSLDQIGRLGGGLFSGVLVIRASKLRYATKPRGGARMASVLSPAKKAVPTSLSNGV